MNKLLLRSLSGALYVGLLVASLLAGSIYFCSLCAVFGVVGIVEYLRLTCGNTPLNIVTTALDVFAMLWLTSLPFIIVFTDSDLAYVLSAGVFISGLYMLVRFIAALYVNEADATRHTAYSVLGVIYLSLGLISAQFLSIFSAKLVLLIFIFIWVNDTGAFITGSLWGKHRLFERLSPKKSWEGFWGGMLLVVLVSLILGYTGVTMRWLGMTPYLGIGPYQIVYGLPVIAVLFATLGDLFESMIKRNAGKKDSGNIIPGHGGLLDRIDSMLFVMPAASIYFIICLAL